MSLPLHHSYTLTYPVLRPPYLHTYLPTLIPISNGRRRRQIPASEPHLLTPASPSPQPRHLALHPRIHPDDLAQSQRGAAARREAHHAGQEEHECEPDEGECDILCTSDSFIYVFNLICPPTYPEFSLPTFQKKNKWNIKKKKKQLTRTQKIEQKLGTLQTHPHPLHHPPPTLPQPPWRLHPRPAHRTPKPTRRPGALGHPRARRRAPRHALRHDG